MGRALLVCLTCVLVCSAIAAVLLGVGSGLLNFVFQRVLEQEISKRMTLEEGHVSYEQLRHPSIPTFKSLYFFNLTNPENFEEGTEKAILQEVGPYSYGEIQLKNFSENGNKSQLSYRQAQYYYFNPNSSGSGLSESDVICIINIPVMVGIYRVLDRPNLESFFKYLLNSTSAQLYTCQNVSGIIWGYTDPFLQELYDMGLSPVEKTWLMVNGSTNSKPSTIYTGVTNISRIAQFLEWNGHKSYLNTWPDQEANRIHGTEGGFFKPNLELGEPLTLFIGELKRAFELQNTAIVDHLGLETFRYRFQSKVFKGAFTESDNAKWGSWCPDGLFYMGPAKDPEIPVYGSKPHFLDGDARLFEGVEGLYPSRDKHDSHIDVEPNIGVNVDFSIQFQLNIRVNISGNFSFLENLQGVDSHGSLFLPVFYINEHAEFSQDLKDYLDDNGLDKIRQMENVVTLLFYVMIGLAAVSALTSIAASVGVICSAFRLKYHKVEEKKPLLDPDLPAAIVHQYFARRRAKDL